MLACWSAAKATGEGMKITIANDKNHLFVQQVKKIIKEAEQFAHVEKKVLEQCVAFGCPGDLKQVLAIHTPLCLVFFESSARSGLHVDWKAACGMKTVSNIVQLARQIGKQLRCDQLQHCLNAHRGSKP